VHGRVKTCAACPKNFSLRTSGGRKLMENQMTQVDGGGGGDISVTVLYLKM